MQCPYDPQWLATTFPDIASIAPLGVGGQKWVFSGTHAQYGAVVLKLFHVGSDDGRAEREIAAIKSIASPRVPPIFVSGFVQATHGQVLWILEQRVVGISLRDLLLAGPLANNQILYIAHHVLEALFAAEQARIVHRDVKPENILVDISSSSAWLIDFGIARHLDLASLTATENIFGPCTAGYAPPEQFKNLKREIDNRADIFSLGVTLFEVVEGNNPYRDGARDARETLSRTLTLSLPRISRAVDPAGDFADLVTAMTRIRPDHRPARVADALEWIQDIRLKQQ